MPDAPSTPAAFDNWLKELLPLPAHVLAQMEESAARHQLDLPGPHVGRLVHQLTQVVGARRIFDYGPRYGYCALWTAFAMGSEGHVTCMVREDGARRRIQDNVDRAHFQERISVIVGDPAETLVEDPRPWDMVFLQFYEPSQLRLLEEAAAHVREGGYVVIFDVLPMLGAPGYASEEAFDPAIAKDLKRLLLGRRDLFTAIVPLGKGLGLCLKVAT